MVAEEIHFTGFDPTLQIEFRFAKLVKPSRMLLSLEHPKVLI